MKDLQAFAAETAAQELREASIFFERENMCARVENKLRQRSQPRPNFHDVVLRSQVRFVHNPTRKVLVMQEILAERFHGRNPNLPKGGVDLRELHGKQASQGEADAKFSALFTKMM